jgi:hypothetical protein
MDKPQTSVPAENGKSSTIKQYVIAGTIGGSDFLMLPASNPNTRKPFAPSQHASQQMQIFQFACMAQ